MYPSIQVDGNLTMVTTKKTTLWFSYTTLIAFRVGANKYVSQNLWSNTTAKHLNTIEPNKEVRLSAEAFQAAVDKLL